MLSCKFDPKFLTDKQLSCGNCNICKARSKFDYPFKKDLQYSEQLVDVIKRHIENNTPYVCRRPTDVKEPDIMVIDVSHQKSLVCRIEAKLLQGYAFMKAAEKLGEFLFPKETLVVDEPKLLSYFKCQKEDLDKFGREIKIFVVWKFDRPCHDIGGITVFQELSELKKIYMEHGKKRKFTRQATGSDYVNGQKIGITEKYHFSLRECRPIEELVPKILELTPSLD